MSEGTLVEVLSGAATWCVVLGDNRPALEALDAGAVAHVITDPPFTQRTSKNARTNNNWKPQSDAHAFIDFDGIEPSDYVAAMLRVATRWTIAFCAMEQLGAYAEAADARWVRAGVWVKPDGAPQFTGDRPAQACEGVAIMHPPGKKRWNNGGGRGYWLESVVQDRSAYGHPTPKPVELMLTLVEQFTDPGELVLDPFAGSGTTGVACLRLGRRFIGIEREPKYHAVAVERRRAEERGLSLREARAGQSSIFDVLGTTE